MPDTTQKEDEGYVDLESPFIDDEGKPRRVVFEVGHPEPVGETCWFKLLCCLGGVFPANGKCECSNIVWSILPLIWFLVWLSVSIMFSEVFWFGLFSLTLPMTLSVTHKSFVKAIVHGKDRVYVNKLAIRGLVFSSVACVIVALLLHFLWNQNIGPILGWTLAFSNLCPMVSVIVTRCLFITHVNNSQQRAFVELVQGDNAKVFQKKLLDKSVQVEQASTAYLQAPLSVCFTLGTVCVGVCGISLYTSIKHFPGATSIGASISMYTMIALLFVYALTVLTPLWILTRIDKQYMWTLYRLLCRNILMKDTERMNLLLAYETIAPRAALFGAYITRGRVLTLTLTLVSPAITKLTNYLISTG